MGALPAIRSATATQYNRIMSTQTSRDRILEALQDLPADATFDDAIERLVFLAKIDAGKRSPMWLMTHRLVDFIRLKLWL